MIDISVIRAVAIGQKVELSKKEGQAGYQLSFSLLQWRFLGLSLFHEHIRYTLRLLIYIHR